MPPFMLFGRLDQLGDDINGSLTNADRYRIWSDSHPAPTVGVAVARPSFEIRSETGEGAQVLVEIENLRDVPLEAWEFFVGNADGRTGIGSSTDAGAALEDAERAGVVRPHAIREIVMGLDAADSSARPAQVTMRFALWRDLSWEGDKGSVDRLFSERDRRANEYAYWIAAFKDALAMEPADAVKYLERRQDERVRATPGEPGFLLSSYPNWKSLSVTAPDRLLQTIDRHRAVLEQQYALLTRHHPSR